VCIPIYSRRTGAVEQAISYLLATASGKFALCLHGEYENRKMDIIHSVGCYMTHKKYKEGLEMEYLTGARSFIHVHGTGIFLFLQFNVCGSLVYREWGYIGRLNKRVCCRHQCGRSGTGTVA
jgi:hypothetical protein